MTKRGPYLFAPFSFRTLAAFTIVPPESIISSTIIQHLSLTFPITFITSDFPGEGLLLSIIANPELGNLLNPLVLVTPPTSGDTQIIFFDLILYFMCLANIGVEKRLSTGISKNP